MTPDARLPIERDHQHANAGRRGLHCEGLAERRFAQGFGVAEVVDINEVKRDACLRVLLKDPRARGLEGPLIEAITGTFRMGIDQLYDSFDELSGRFVPLLPPG